MKKILIIYLLGYLISWTLIAGWINADQQYDAQHRFASLYNDDAAPFRHRSDWGFAVTWAAFVSLTWPIFLPGCYAMGLAQHGWTLRIQPLPAPPAERKGK